MKPAKQRTPLETLQRVRRAGVEAAERTLVERLDQAERARARLQHDQQRVSQQRDARTEIVQGELQAASGEGTRAHDLAQLHLHCEHSRLREQELARSVERSRSAAESALGAERAAREVLLEANTDEKLGARALERERARERVHREGIEEEEALETWTTGRRA